MNDKNNIYDLSFEELGAFVSSINEADYRSEQIWRGLYHHLWMYFDEFTDLSKDIRKKLADNFSTRTSINTGKQPLNSLDPVSKMVSSDGLTLKTLFAMEGGQLIEAVLMRYDKRNTLCISTQAGCAMGCVFCATGQMGFKRQLTSGEIIQQVLHYARQLASENEQVTNIVIMGMGEPFHNYDSTMTAIRRLNDSRGYNLGARRFTISTVGLVPGIRRFTQEHSQVNLAISLHAADDDLRTQLLPINKKYPIDELFSACKEYVQVTHRRLSFEWALIQGVNDTPDQAFKLAQRLKIFHTGGSTLCHVNLIPLNPTEKYAGHATTHLKAIAFQNILEDAGIPCTIRLRRGIEIQAGCGQLAIKELSNR